MDKTLDLDELERVAENLFAPTPALALCAALLAAMIGEEAKPSPPSTVTP